MGQPMRPIRRVMRTPQAADHVGLSPSTLEKYRLTGNGPPYQKAGPKIVVYRLEDLDAWLDANRRRSTSDLDCASQMPRSDRLEQVEEPDHLGERRPGRPRSSPPTRRTADRAWPGGPRREAGVSPSNPGPASPKRET
jgi:hypothetical protein